MRCYIVLIIGFIFVLGIGGCATTKSGYRESLPPTSEYVDPDEQLKEYEQLLDHAKKEGKNIEVVRLRIEELALKFPSHYPSVMKAAKLAYDANEKMKAQQLLDNLLSKNHLHPDVAILRARIAMEDGNSVYAKNLLSKQIYLSPADAALREAYASALFLRKEYEEAITSLKTALKLGAPKGRVYYHIGLIEETLSNIEEARSYYKMSIKEDSSMQDTVNPRLVALEFEAL